MADGYREPFDANRQTLASDQIGALAVPYLRTSHRSVARKFSYVTSVRVKTEAGYFPSWEGLRGGWIAS